LSLGNDEKSKTERKKIERMVLVVHTYCVFLVLAQHLQMKKVMEKDGERLSKFLGMLVGTVQKKEYVACDVEIEKQ
jgi:hypothetical protein